MKARPAAAPPPSRPDPGGHLSATLAADWKRYRRRLKACRTEFSEEAVHESRIATRRLLATVDLLGGVLAHSAAREARRALRRHLKTFAELRDVQAQLELAGALPAPDRERAAFADFLRRRERQLIRETRKAVRRLRAGRLARAVKALGKQLQAHVGATPVETLLGQVHEVLVRTYAVVAERHRAISAPEPRTIHRTRVAFKRFRYMVEALAPLLADATPARLQALRAFQACMGDIQDAEVLREKFDAFAAREKLPARRRAPVDDKLVDRQRTLIRRFLRVAHRLSTFRPTAASA